jgi:hypothetical protein
MIGCAGMIAAVAFVFGVIGSLFATEASLGERLMIALMPAAMAFIAAFLLFSRDHARHVATMRSVRRMLLDREDINDSDYLAQFPDADSTLIAQTRRAVSEFFDVPVQKIHPTDSLRKDLRFDTLEPGFHSFVVYRVFAARNVEPQPFAFNTSDLSNIGDLSNEIQRVLDSFKSANQSNEGVQ